MGPDRGGTQLMALWAVSSFSWLSYSLEKHALHERVRLSAFAIFFLSGTIIYILNFFSGWLPGANGRFDDDAGPLKVGHANHPPRPRRYSLPALALCIVARVELFKRVNYDLQCSKPALECLLPLVILSIELAREHKPKTERDNDGDDDDMANTIFDDIWTWAQSSRSILVLATLIPTYGAYLALQPSARSTVFCSTTDRKSLVVALQWAGLLLDSVMLLLLWRILAWARTTRSRLRSLAFLLFLSSLGVEFVATVTSLLKPTSTPTSDSLPLKGINSLYMFDVAVDSVVFSVFLISASLFMCDSTPLTLTSLITFVGGLLASLHGVLQVGSFAVASAPKALFPLYISCFGFALYLSHNKLRYVFFLRRALFTLLLVVLVLASTLFALFGRPSLDDHPLHKIIYSTRIEQDRWLRHATVSTSLRVAAQEYRERNHGREPPEGFDAWYQFATDRNSVIIDHFDQIRRDLLPFWGMKPSELRESVKALSSEPNIAIITIKDHSEVSHNLQAEDPQKPDLDGLVEMIKTFVQHLPDMEFAINLNESPRVLTPWSDLQGLIQKGKPGKMKLLTQRSVEQLFDNFSVKRDATEESKAGVSKNIPFLDPRDFRHMNAITCPPGSAARAGTYWDIRDLCISCLSPHSQNQYLTNWQLSTNLCHQPDLLRLHGFYLTPPALPPWQDLKPVFSRAKTDAFNDILIPLPHANDTQPQDNGNPLEMKGDRLSWSGDLKTHRDPSTSHHALLRGGHQTRLVHLVNNASASDKTTILLPSRSSRGAWAYEQAWTAQLNGVLPFDVGFGDLGDDCGAACEREFGRGAPRRGDDRNPLDSRYVLLTDTDAGGPPPRGPGIAAALRSTSVPFVASVFREWSSERLAPWLHFVPVDVRLHALHGTLAYFAGVAGRGSVGGRDPGMRAAVVDAVWIAEQGRRWAGRALRREDEEVYLFRVLLEWGRLVGDGREGMVFRVQDGEGEGEERIERKGGGR